ncbi:MAG: MBL fold metallo-hydrolase, partial [Armatimonadia bacterium]
VPGTKTPDSLGGGYFIWHKGHGIVIDPGYDFLENFAAAGGRVCDVHTVILTHAHPDHTADLERLCTLLHEYHENGEASQSPEPTRRVRFLLSNGALVKFSGMLPLRGVNYIDRVDTLTPGCSFDLADNVRLQIIHAWHDDVLARDQSVGLWFEFGGPGSSRRLLFTSDTGLFPLKRDGDKSPDQSGPEVWAGYPHEAEQLVRPDLMITHIGSIQEAELEIGGDLTPEDACYANHLGIIGTARLITKCRPRLAVVSEFGEEMRDFRTTLIEGLQEKVIDHVFTGQPDNERPRVVLGDLPFIYDMVTGTVYDCVDQDWLAPGEIAFIQADDDELKVGKGLVYYHRRAVTPDKDDLNRRVEEHWHHIKWRRGLYFKEKD